MKHSVCPINHHEVLSSSNLAPWLNWPRVSIEDYNSGKCFETRRCPSCDGEFKRQIFISAVVYPVEVALLQSTIEDQALDLQVPEGWPTDPKEFGRALRRRRNAAGLSRAELSALSSIAVGTIRNVENCWHRPTQNIIERLTAVPQLQEITVQETAVDMAPPPLRISVKAKPPTSGSR